MANLLPWDPPGTINPAKLSMWAEVLPDVGVPDSTDPPAPPETTPTDVGAVSQDTEAATQTPAEANAAAHRLTRISSDCTLEDDPLLKENPKYEDMRQEFEQSFADRLRPCSRRTRHLSHHGYFKRHVLSQAEVLVPLDPDASLDSVVVMDKASASIYDAYLLRADIAKNLNTFHRCQVCPPTTSPAVCQPRCLPKRRSQPIIKVLITRPPPGVTLDCFPCELGNLYSLDPGRTGRPASDRAPNKGIQSEISHVQIPHQLPQEDGSSLEPEIRPSFWTRRKFHLCRT
jgi:hypothetical protein